jgi:phage baseplate assembly protein W
MASYSVRLPITLDDTDGFGMIKDIQEMIRQNLKMLILTNPGERMMDPNFGVGMKQFLFQTYSENVYAEIDSKIREQVSIYIPAVKIQDVKFYSIEEDSNILKFRLVYSIPAIAINDLLDLTI